MTAHATEPTITEANEITGTVLPPKDAARTLAPITALLRQRKTAELVAADGHTRIPLPDEVFEVLQEVAQAMLDGKAIRITALGQRLTTSQAASMLGISRPTLIKLLEERKIPYEQPRRHRLVRLDDVLAYQRRRRAEVRAGLDELTSQAVADGLYDTSADDYREALARAKQAEADEA